MTLSTGSSSKNESRLLFAVAAVYVVVFNFPRPPKALTMTSAIFCCTAAFCICSGNVNGRRDPRGGPDVGGERATSVPSDMGVRARLDGAAPVAVGP